MFRNLFPQAFDDEQLRQRVIEAKEAFEKAFFGLELFSEIKLFARGISPMPGLT